MAHTNGQWELRVGVIGREWNGKLHPVATVAQRLEWHENRGKEAEEVHANARVLLAAPDLLEALEMALAESRAFVDVDPSSSLVCEPEIRAAIAKARGE